MGFLSKAFKSVGKLFKKKPGGTFIGNLIRKATGRPLPGGGRQPVEQLPGGMQQGLAGVPMSEDSSTGNEIQDYILNFMDTDEGQALVQSGRSLINDKIIYPWTKKITKNVANNQVANDIIATYGWERFKIWFSKNWLWVIIPCGFLIILFMVLKSFRGKRR